ncbi:DUF423 domain-containing protein [Legionella yabuuchiae]|uniref:DUF423 domain-containing protein n=1 Tax=Legionella yabuuchiae TaxID=376727 RepID=UPI0010565ACB|nr:DUF423 domain-containing protein [Legionella yabuuchiae]
MATISGFLATGFGAFGAHALKETLSEHQLAVYNTGVQYQFVHTLALLSTGLILFHRSNHWIKASGIAFITGIILFSGSLYLLTFTGINQIGIITPFGGSSFLIGWILLSIGLTKTD